MSRPRALVLAAAMAAVPAVAQEPLLASQLDYSLNAARDVPIACKAGDTARFPGKTLAQVFGDAWPLQPEPQPDAERVRAQMTAAVRPRGAMRGMPVQPGVVVFAVLVAADGQPLQVEILCASTEGYDAVIRRMALRSAYRPAVINGAPVTSVSVQVQKFAGGGN